MKTTRPDAMDVGFLVWQFGGDTCLILPILGRVGVPYAGLSAAKLGLTIAIKYAEKCTQFGPGGGDEISILDNTTQHNTTQHNTTQHNTTHQRRLMPLLARAYAFYFGQQYSLGRYVNKTEEDG